MISELSAESNRARLDVARPADEASKARDPSSLFRPFHGGGMDLANRIAMAPMTRFFAQAGVPCVEAQAYYRRRAQGGAGLIITEGTSVPHWASSYDDRAPFFHGDQALQAWQPIVEQVHQAGARIMPQLWHVGLVERPQVEGLSSAAQHVSGVGPSGLLGNGTRVAEPMTEHEIEAVITAFAEAAASAQRLGFDGVEIHGAHGYLLDQFFWPQTNQRTDHWGGDIRGRTRFAAALIKACRAAVGPAFPIVLRFSQWKQQDYAARLADRPKELEAFLSPLIEAGTSVFHCSTRRFWEPEFPYSPLTLAGWTKVISGLPVIAVGSVGLDSDFISSMFENKGGAARGINDLIDRMEADEFDIIAIGRAMVSNPSWPQMVRDGRDSELRDYDQQSLMQLE